MQVPAGPSAARTEAVNDAQATGRQPRVGGPVVGVSRAGLGRPGRSEIGELDLQAFDFEPQLPPPEKISVTTPPGVSLRELDRQQVQHGVLAGRARLAALAARTRSNRSAARQRRISGSVAFRRLPVETVEADHQALLLRSPDARPRP